MNKKRKKLCIKYQQTLFNFTIALIVGLLQFPLPLHSKFTDYTTTVDADIVQALYQIMYDTHTILTHHKVPYFINYGTLIGALRHQGIVPWDDDVDICLMEKDASSFISLGPIFSKLGYELHAEGELIGFRIGYQQKFRPGLSYEYPYLDIFAMVQRENKITFACHALSFPSISPTCWPNSKRHKMPAYCTVHELYPLRKYRFGSFFVYGPHDPIAMLSAEYGKDFFITGVSSGPHLKPHKKAIFTLDEEDLIPAQPIELLRQNIHPDLLDTGLFNEEKELIFSLTQTASVIFEWATGTHQPLFSTHAKKYYTVSAHHEWLSKSQQSTQNSPTTFMHAPLASRIYGNHEALKENYTRAITRTEESSFDLVIIRGREKLGCALRSIPYLTSESTVIIDGFIYLSQNCKNTLLMTFDLIDQIKTMAVLKLKNIRNSSDETATTSI